MELIHHQKQLIPMIDHYLDIKRYQQALDLIYEGLAEQPENSYLHYQAARALYHLDEYRQAEEHLHSAFKFGYSPVEIHYLLGHIYSDQENWQLSERAYISALHVSPNNARVMASYGALLMKVGQWKHGREVMNEAQRLSPNDPEVLRHHIYYDIARNHNNSRIMHLEKYINRADNQVSALLQLGINDYYKGNYKSAKEHFREAYVKNPTDKNLLNNVRLLEYKANPLLFPITISDKIGGMPFLWFWVVILLLSVYPFQESSMNYGIIGVIVLSAYIYLARIIVNLHQDALDSNDTYAWAFIKSPIFIRLIGIIVAVSALFIFHIPGVPIVTIIGSRLIANYVEKKGAA